MPFNRPSLADLWNRVGALWRATFPGADTNLRNSPDRAFVGVIARSTDEDLSYLDWQVLQLFPFSAEVSYLERWAAWKNIRRKPATPGSGTIAFTGAVPGKVAQAGSQMQDASGVLVELVADCVGAVDGTATAMATAVLDINATAGAITNLGIGAQLTFVGTPPGFPDAGTVATTFSGGADAETDAQLRRRTQRAYAQPSFGGNQDDWQNAALAVAGVTRVFTSPSSPTPGSVTIWPLLDAIRANGIPVGTDAWYRPGTGPSAGTGGAGDQLLVLDAILAQRPVSSQVYVKAATTQAIALTIAGLATSSVTVKAAIAAEFANMLVAKLAAADQDSNGIGVLSTGYTIYLEWIYASIAQASGVKHFDLSAPGADVAIPAGTIAVPGVITYT